MGLDYIFCCFVGIEYNIIYKKAGAGLMVTLDFSKCKTKEDVDKVFSKNKKALKIAMTLKEKYKALKQEKD